LLASNDRVVLKLVKGLIHKRKINIGAFGIKDGQTGSTSNLTLIFGDCVFERNK
jgi:hypothetical protein